MFCQLAVLAVGRSAKITHVFKTLLELVEAKGGANGASPITCSSLFPSEDSGTELRENSKWATAQRTA